jgi:hypothetical protein
MRSEVPEAFKNYFRDLYSDCFRILVSRQEGYGPTNIEALGPHGVFSRLAFDKCARVMNSMNGHLEGGKVQLYEDWYSEEVRDALIDIANYSMIMIALGEEQWSKLARDNGTARG